MDSGNEFLKLSLAVNTFAVTDSVMVAGRCRSVNKLMLCKKSWVENNWINPMQRVQTGKSNPARLKYAGSVVKYLIG